MFNPHKFVYWVRSLPFSLFMYLKEKQYKIAMILLCPVQGPWASSLWILIKRLIKCKYRCFYLKTCCYLSVIANWLEGRTIKYTNFPAKYMNSRSKLHWNIHVVLCQVSVTWNKRRGIGIPELHDHAERHSAFNTSSKWISLIFYFYDIFLVLFPLMWCLQVYWH